LVDHRPPRPARTVEPAHWIEPRLIDAFGAVTRTVPGGFDAYARVLHPANHFVGDDYVHVRWADVARMSGRTMHPLAQYSRISDPAPGADVDALQRVTGPKTGDLEPDVLGALCGVLAMHTDDPSSAYLAVWEGWGEFSGGTAIAYATMGEPVARPQPAPREWQLDVRAPMFELPARRYWLYAGPLNDALAIGHWSSADDFWPRSPNLFWPADRSWCVATEVDFDSTLVGGTSELIRDILDDGALEAWPVGPADSLAFDADVINAN
jgi:hypothetical protein